MQGARRGERRLDLVVAQIHHVVGIVLLCDEPVPDEVRDDEDVSVVQDTRRAVGTRSYGDGSKALVGKQVDEVLH